MACSDGSVLTCFHQDIFVLGTCSPCLIDLGLEFCNRRIDFLVLFPHFVECSILGLLLVAKKAPIPVAATDLLHANLVVVGERLQIVLDMHATDGSNLRQRLLEILDTMSLRGFVEPCKNGGRLLRIGLYLRRLSEVSNVYVQEQEGLEYHGFEICSESVICSNAVDVRAREMAKRRLKSS
jgi:hypothetical protein